MTEEQASVTKQAEPDDTGKPIETRHYIGLTPEGWRVSLKGEGRFAIPAGEPMPFGAAMLYQVSDEISRAWIEDDEDGCGTGRNDTDEPGQDAMR